MSFNQLHTEFEKRNTDLFLLQQKPGFSKYILVRSLDKQHLLKLIAQRTLPLPNKPKIDDYYQAVYDSTISIQDLINFIRSEYPAVKSIRQDQEQYLPTILTGFTNVKCGVRNDNLNDLVSGLVRDKTIQSKQELDTRIHDLINNSVQDYIYWQYYNQASSDLLEHIFNDHPKVIPTLRKIKYVDFLIELNGEIVPFDLKVTHLSEEYYNLLKSGLISQANGDDDYVVGANTTEIQEIKEFYKSVKNKYSLPNYGQFTKLDLINELKKYASSDPSISRFLTNITLSRSQLVQETERNLKKACWWNYKYQGERLFKNNNRFYIFLAYKDSYEDPRPLKGNLTDIKLKVDNLINNLTSQNLMTIKYKYQKDPTFNGPYKVNALSVIVIK